MQNYSIVHFVPDRKGYSCGYCKSADTNFSDGMWAHGLTVHDYQDLIDRGWRRSGHYCYKPIMDVTCCPLYTIKCEALDFKLSRSQKKVLKKMCKFLESGNDKMTTSDTKNSEESDNEAEGGHINDIPDLDKKALDAEKNQEKITLEKIEFTACADITEEKIVVQDMTEEECIGTDKKDVDTESNSSAGDKNAESTTRFKTPRSGVGIDHAKPLCKKAKLIRLEKKQKKMADRGIALSESCTKKPANIEKSLEDFINEPFSRQPAHNLELRLVRSYPMSEEFRESFDAELELYQKYQQSVHQDPPGKCTKQQFTRFLVTSPLMPYRPKRDGPLSGYGSFHQQYWLDGKLLAVGVIDILPKCLSSVYFFYDPDYAFLTLGTYGSLREVAFVRSLVAKAPSIRSYYMGFYAHSCVKMRYKARLYPSYLLCPEVYTWHPVGHCLPKLDASKYSRLNDDAKATCKDSEVHLNEVLVLWNHIAMPYSRYKPKSLPGEEEVIQQYALLVGRKCAERILYYVHRE